MGMLSADGDAEVDRNPMWKESACFAEVDSLWPWHVIHTRCLQSVTVLSRRIGTNGHRCGSYCASSNAMCSNASSWARSIGQHICSVKATLCWSTLYHHVSSHLGKSIFHTRPHEDPQASSAIEPASKAGTGNSPQLGAGNSPQQ